MAKTKDNTEALIMGITEGEGAAHSEPLPSQKWRVVGLEKAESMVIDYAGRSFDLAQLTEEEAVYLLEQGRDAVPYLERA